MIEYYAEKIGEEFFAMVKKLLCAALGVAMSACVCAGASACSKKYTGKDGKSAYEIWLEQGNTGSQSDFLQWLKGADGADGKDGKDGKDGTNGSNGSTGKSAFEIFLEYNPNYEGTEEEWIEEYLASMGGGVSIEKIEKTRSEGLVDYYTITFTNGDTYEFTITNGANGKDGKDGADGKDGKDLTAYEMYQEYVKQYGDSLTYDQFCHLLFDNGSKQPMNAVGNALLSSLSVYCEFTTETIVGSSTTLDTQLTTGSAVIYKVEEDYTYLATNYHVVYLRGSIEKISTTIHAYLYGRESAPYSTNLGYAYDNDAILCEYVGGSIDYDVAILKVSTKTLREFNDKAKAVDLANGYDVGEDIFAIGNTGGKGIGVTGGIISVDRETIRLSIDGTVREYSSLRTDANISHGNSGGGLFNKEGKLVGLNHAGDPEHEFMNNAIPVQLLSSVADGILSYSKNEPTLKGTKKLGLGIVVKSNNSRFVYNETENCAMIKEDLSVHTVTAGSIGSALGLRIGDILLEFIINDEIYKLNRAFNIGDLLLKVKAGDKIAFRIARGDAEGRTYNYTIKNSDLIIVS